MALRQNAIPVGAIEYLLRGCGCDPEKERLLDLEKAVERGQGLRVDHQREHNHSPGHSPGQERDAAAYFDRAVGQGEPAGVWFGTGMESLGLTAREGDVARPDEVRAVFGQLRRPGALGPDGEADWIGAKPRQYPSKAEKLAKLIALEPGGEATAERRVELEDQVAAADHRKAVAYYDWTFSPVKSVSVYYAALLATGDDAGAAAVRAAHERAVREAMAYAEQHVAWSRNGSHGRNAEGDRVGEFVRGVGLTMTAFGHSTSRENEPQLHTHVALLNRIAFLLESGELKIGALDSRGFFAMKQAIEAVYTRSLEDQLTEERGVAFQTRPDGKAREITGIGPDLIAEASTRRSQVLARLEELVAEYVERTGHEPAQATRHRLAETAALSTRPDKSEMSGPAGVHAWGEQRVDRLLEALAEVEAAGDVAGLAALLRDAETGPVLGSESGQGPVATVREPGHEAGQELGAVATGEGRVAAGREGVAAGDSAVAARGQRMATVVEAAVAAGVADVQAAYPTFVLGTLVAAIDAHLPASSELGIARTERGAYLERLAHEVVGAGGLHEVVQLTGHEPVAVPAALCREADGRPRFRPHMDQRYTTAAHLAREDALVARFSEPAAPALDEPGLLVADERLMSKGLSPDQRAAALGVLASDRRGSILIGPAGTGKSRTVMALAHEWSAATGGRVFGIATSERATANLKSDGLRALNTTNFLRVFDGDSATGAPAREALGAGDLVVIDEASMSSTDHLDRISRLVAAAGARVLPVGDHAQLQSVGAGGMFAVLAEKVEPAQRHELTEVHRFAADWEKAASLRLRDGDASVFAEYDARGRVHTGTLEEMQDGAARAYVTDRLAGRSALLIASTHAQAAILSDTVRRELVELGRVGATTVGRLGDQTELGLGDVVLALRNDYRLRVDPAPPGPDGRPGSARSVMNKELYTVVGRQRDGTLLVRDARGATAHLPPAYVAKHLALGYAVTGHGAQGVTVDAGHGIPDRDATRESLYTQSTRGIAENHIWMPTERAPDAHDLERIHDMGPARFADIMERRSVEPAAVEVRDRYQAEASSLGSATARLQVELAAAARAHHERVLDQLAADGVLDPDQLARLRSPVERSDRERLEHALRGAELAGHDVAAVLDAAIRGRELHTADSVGDVLRHRITVATGRPTANGPARSWVAIVAPHAPTADEPDLERDIAAARGTYLAEVAALSDARQAEIGARALETQPEWAVALLGPVPAAEHGPDRDPDRDPEREGARAEWARAAGVIGAARETLGIPDDRVSLGEAPSPERVIERHLWRAAMNEVTTAPEIAGRDWRAAGDAELYQARERWSRELDQAPEWVGDDLAHSHRLIRDWDGDAVRDAVRAIREHADPDRAAYLASSADASRRLAEREREQAAELETAHQARQAWWNEHGADYDRDSRAAGAELARRGLPLERGVEHPADSAPEHDIEPGDELDADPSTVPVLDDVLGEALGAPAGVADQVDHAQQVDPTGQRRWAWDQFVEQLRAEHGTRLDPEHQLGDENLAHARAAEIAAQRVRHLSLHEPELGVDERTADEPQLDVREPEARPVAEPGEPEAPTVDEPELSDDRAVASPEPAEPMATVEPEVVEPEVVEPEVVEPEVVEAGPVDVESTATWAQRMADQAELDQAAAATAAAEQRQAELDRVAAEAEQQAVTQRETREAEQVEREQTRRDAELDAQLAAIREPDAREPRTPEHALDPDGLEYEGADREPDRRAAERERELEEGYELGD